MTQAITTKYIPATAKLDARFKARAAAGQLTIFEDARLTWGENHAEAARLLCQKLHWDGKWHMGTLISGNFCFVRENEEQ